MQNHEFLALDGSSHFSSGDIHNVPQMSWMKIASCVDHELYLKLGSVLRSIVRSADAAIDEAHVDEASIQTVMNILKTKRGLPLDERVFLRKLIGRALQLQTDQAHHENEDVDAIRQEDVLQDIFDVHSAFKFSNCHFEEYTQSQFMRDIIRAGLKFPFGRDVRERMSFHPQYIIHDDMFKILQYMFSMSSYAQYLRQHLKPRHKRRFELKLVVVPEAVRSVYDADNKFECSFHRMSDYLFKRHGEVFDKIVLRGHADLDNTIRTLYDVERIESEACSKLVVIVDRRHVHCKNDILYLLNDDVSELRTLDDNHCIGLDFHFEAARDALAVYLRCARGEKLRFFPEQLTQIIPRLFKRPHRTADAVLLDQIYAHSVKHGWATLLNDEAFDEQYKRVMGTNHVSVNYNRAVLRREYSCAREVLFFRDLLHYEMKAGEARARSGSSEHQTSEQSAVVRFTNFCVENEYDSESIIEDGTASPSNLQMFFKSRDEHAVFAQIRSIVQKYTTSSQQQQLSHWQYAKDALEHFEVDGFKVDALKYDLSALLSAHGHIIRSRTADEKEFKATQQHLSDSLGYCSLKDCPALSKHVQRTRERAGNVLPLHNEVGGDAESINEIISATLCALHCKLQHREPHLFRRCVRLPMTCRTL